MSPGLKADEIRALGEAALLTHQGFLERAQPLAETLQDRTWPAFMDCLKETQRLLVLVATTRGISFEKWRRRHAIDSGSPPFIDHPHWELLFSTVTDSLYPRAWLHLNDRIDASYVPGNLSLELLDRGLWDPDKEAEPPPSLGLTHLLRELAGDKAVLVDSYLAGLQANLFILLGQRDDERAHDEPPFAQYRPAGPLAAQRVVYHVACSLGLGTAIEYLENLWRDGWLQNEYLYGSLWLGLMMRSLSAGQDSLLAPGWPGFIVSVQNYPFEAEPDEAALIGAAEQILGSIRASIRQSRREARDLSDWLVRIHSQLLPIRGLVLIQAMSERLAMSTRVQTDLIRLWRYALETHADISLFIQNPFGLPLEKLRVSLRPDIDARARRRALAYWNHGRLLLPDSVLELVDRLADLDAKDLSDPEQRESVLSALLLDHMTPIVREAYETACYLTIAELIAADEPVNDRPDGRSTAQSQYLAAFFLQIRLWSRVQGAIGIPLTYAAGLEGGGTLTASCVDGSPMHIRASAKGGPRALPETLESVTDAERDDIFAKASKRFGALLRIMYDILSAIDVLRRYRDYDPAALVDVAISRDREPYCFVMQFIAGEPGTLILMPRGLVFEEGPKVTTSLMASLYGVLGTQGLLSLRSREEGRFAEMEVRALMSMGAEQQFQVSMGRPRDLEVKE